MCPGTGHCFPSYQATPSDDRLEKYVVKSESEYESGPGPEPNYPTRPGRFTVQLEFTSSGTLGFNGARNI